MSKLKNRTLVILIIIILILTGGITFYSLKNYKLHSETSLKYKNMNTVLEEKIAKTEDSINLYNSKVKAIDDNLLKMHKLSKKYDSLTLNKNIQSVEKYILKSMEGNFDKDRKNSMKNINTRYRKLRSAFFADDEVANLEEAKTNILISSALLNNFVYSKLNNDISRNNNEVYKLTGLFNAYENSNYFVKNILAQYINKNDIPLKTVKDNVYNNLFIYNNVINAYDALLFPSSTNYTYLLSLRDLYTKETQNLNIKKSDDIDNNIKEMLKSLDNCVLFGFDTFSQNIDYMHDYDIIDKTFETDNGVKVLRYLIDKRGRLYCAEERINGVPKTMDYFNSSGNPFILVDMENYKIYYFSDGIKSDVNKYNQAVEIYKSYKRN